jgi:two-component system sensor histidine kinase DesK
MQPATHNTPGATPTQAAILQPNNPAFAQYRWLFRVPPLLYSVSWFLTPLHQHSPYGWAAYAVFYSLFLLAYFQLFSAPPRAAKLWLTVMFLIGYIYYPFNESAAGEFVFPVVLSVFFLRQPKASAALARFAVFQAWQALVIVIETRLLHHNRVISEEIIFFSIAIGLSNFAYSRHVLASEQLQQANREIEHLTQIAERERIARDLHDLLGHTLTVIALKSDIANRLFTAQPELAHREIAEVEATARKALAEVREAVSGYRAEGFASEVSRARHALSSAGVQLTTDLDFIPVPPALTTTLCLVLREATTNVIRHAAATSCRVQLHRVAGFLKLTVEDNGSGSSSPEGNGLRGMRERLTLAGGTLLRVRVQSGGTRIVASLPLASETRAPLSLDLPNPAEPAFETQGPETATA